MSKKDDRIGKLRKLTKKQQRKADARRKRAAKGMKKYKFTQKRSWRKPALTDQSSGAAA